MKTSIVGLLVMLISAGAYADEVKDRADRFAKTVASAKESCGSAISASYDVKPELATKRSRAPGTGYEYCEEVVQAIRSTCSEADAKPIVAAKLHSVTCRFEDGSTAKVNAQSSKAGWMHDVDFALDKAVLTVTFDFNSGNIDRDTSRFLRSSLGIDDARALKRHQKDFADEIEKTNSACGATIAATYDLASELTAERDSNRDYGNGYTFCVNVLEGIENVCANTELKPLLAAKLKRVQCKMEHGSSEKIFAKSKAERAEPRFTDVSMAGDTLTVLFDWKTGNVTNEVSSFLRSSVTPPTTGPGRRSGKHH